MITSLIGILLVFCLLLLGVPIGIGMAIIGTAGFAYIVGVGPALSMLGQIAYETPVSYSLTIIPLFILMGNFIARAGLSQGLYDAAYSFLGHYRGGLALTTLAACGAFSAVSGSSLATAATMSKVAMPQMRNYKYSDSLATGVIAAGGTLGILIPPSVLLVLYGIMTNNDIGKLFIAGIIPGVIALIVYGLAVWYITLRNPQAGPRGERSDWPTRINALKGSAGIGIIFLIVIGGLYMGVFTPTEAAAVGAGSGFIFSLIRKTLTLDALFSVLNETARMTAMIFVILIGAFLFSNFINVAGLPRALVSWTNDLELSPLVILLGIMAIYIILGCMLESMSMMLLTVPIFYPVIVNLGFDPIWFGIIVVVVIEISLITPPIGLNVFIMKATLPDVPIRTMFTGVIPFVMADIIRLALLIIIPGLVVYLPSLM